MNNQSPVARLTRELTRQAGEEILDEVRTNFMNDLTVGVGEVARDLGVSPELAGRAIRELRWDEDRKDLFKIGADAEVMRYREMIKDRRLPIVEVQINTLEALNAAIARIAGNPRLVDTPRAAKDLADALDKAAGISEKLLNIHANLFGEGPNALGISNTLFLVPGALPSRTRQEDRPEVLDVTPED